jgi:hypothetical protein
MPYSYYDYMGATKPWIALLKINALGYRDSLIFMAFAVVGLYKCWGILDQ